MTDLRAILSRIDAATGPDIELDGLIGREIIGFDPDMLPTIWPDIGSPLSPWPPFTASLDAVVALVEREHGTGVPIRMHIAAHWCKAFVGFGLNPKGECKRPDRQIALAVLWSYLQALIAEAEQS